MPLLESALGTLSELGSIAGTFISRRFGQEAWPLLQRLLKDGPPGRDIIAPGGPESTAGLTLSLTWHHFADLPWHCSWDVCLLCAGVAWGIMTLTQHMPAVPLALDAKLSCSCMCSLLLSS